MYIEPFGPRSRPQSIQEARHYALALLILGPGAPAPRQRSHPGLLPDVYEAVAPRRPSVFSRALAYLRPARATDKTVAEEERPSTKDASHDTVAGRWLLERQNERKNQGTAA